MRGFDCAAGVCYSEGAGKQRGAMRWGERFALTGVCGEVGGVKGVGCAAGDGEWDERKRASDGGGMKEFG